MIQKSNLLTLFVTAIVLGHFGGDLRADYPVIARAADGFGTVDLSKFQADSTGAILSVENGGTLRVKSGGGMKFLVTTPTVGQVLGATNVDGTVGWTSPSALGVTAVTAGSGLIGGGGPGAITIDAGAGNGITVGANDIGITLGTANYVLGMNSGATASEYKAITGTADEIDITHTVGGIQIGLVNPLIVGKGGTGAATLTANALLYGNGTSALGSLGLGTTTTVLHGNAAGVSTWGPVSLTADVSGTLPAGNLPTAAADGTTLGAMAGAAADFDASSGVFSIDYTNGQAATGSVKGFLTAADWTTFNAKAGWTSGVPSSSYVLRSDGTGIIGTSALTFVTATGQLAIPTTGSGAGISLGGDVNIYRSASDTARIPDSLIVDTAGAFGPYATLGGPGGISQLAVGSQADFTDLAIENYLDWVVGKTGSVLSLNHAGGTKASPTTLTDTSIVGVVRARAYNATLGNYVSVAHLGFRVDGVSGSDSGGLASLAVASTSTAIRNVFTVRGDGYGEFYNAVEPTWLVISQGGDLGVARALEVQDFAVLNALNVGGTSDPGTGKLTVLDSINVGATGAAGPGTNQVFIVADSGANNTAYPVLQLRDKHNGADNATSGAIGSLEFYSEDATVFMGSSIRAAVRAHHGGTGGGSTGMKLYTGLTALTANLSIAPGGLVIIGDSFTAGGSATAQNDLLVTDDLEIDGEIHQDGTSANVFAGVINGPNGTASLPAFTGTDTDTGIGFGTNIVNIGWNGAVAAVFDTNGLSLTQPTIGSNVLKMVSTSTGDDPSMRWQQYRATTTDGTQTTLGAPTLTSNMTSSVEAHVICRQTGASDQGAYYIIRAIYKNPSGTAALVGSATTTTVGESTAGWDVTLDASGATARVRVTGAAATNLTWHATVIITEVGS